MRPDLLEGMRTLQWSGLHSGITDTLNDVDCIINACQARSEARAGGDGVKRGRER